MSGDIKGKLDALFAQKAEEEAVAREVQSQALSAENHFWARFRTKVQVDVKPAMVEFCEALQDHGWSGEIDDRSLDRDQPEITCALRKGDAPGAQSILPRLSYTASLHDRVVTRTFEHVGMRDPKPVDGFNSNNREAIEEDLLQLAKMVIEAGSWR